MTKKLDQMIARFNDRLWNSASEERKRRRVHRDAYRMGRTGRPLTMSYLVSAIAERAALIDEIRTRTVANIFYGKQRIEAMAQELAYQDGRWQLVRSRPPKKKVEPEVKSRPEATSGDGPVLTFFKRLAAAFRPEKATDASEAEDDLPLEDDPPQRAPRRASEPKIAHVSFAPEVDADTRQLITRHNLRHEDQDAKALLYVGGIVTGVLVFLGSLVVDFAIMSEFWTRALANEFLEVPPDLIASVWSKSAQIIFSAFAIHFFLRAIGPFWRVYMLAIFALTVCMLLGFGVLVARSTMGGVAEQASTSQSVDETLAAMGLGGAGAQTSAAPPPAAKPATTSMPLKVPGKLGEWVGRTLNVSEENTIYLGTLSLMFLIVTSVGALCMRMAEHNFECWVASRRHVRRSHEFRRYDEAWADWYLSAATLQRVDDAEMRRTMLLDYMMGEVSAYYRGMVDRGTSHFLRLVNQFLRRVRGNEPVFPDDPPDGPEYYDLCVLAFEKWRDLNERVDLPERHLPPTDPSIAREQIGREGTEEDAGQRAPNVVHFNERLHPPVGEVTPTKDDRV